MNYKSLKAIADEIHNEYELIQGNIELPEGYSSQFNQKIVGMNVKIRKEIQDMHSSIEAYDKGDADLVDLITKFRDIHVSFADWYGVILNKDEKFEVENLGYKVGEVPEMTAEAIRERKKSDAEILAIMNKKKDEKKIHGFMSYDEDGSDGEKDYDVIGGD